MNTFNTKHMQELENNNATELLEELRELSRSHWDLQTKRWATSLIYNYIGDRTDEEAKAIKKLFCDGKGLFFGLISTVDEYCDPDSGHATLFDYAEYLERTLKVDYKNVLDAGINRLNAIEETGCIESRMICRNLINDATDFLGFINPMVELASKLRSANDNTNQFEL
jgi:hypothetical protein